jgi:hypothetical protein
MKDRREQTWSKQRSSTIGYFDTNMFIGYVEQRKAKKDFLAL